MVRRRMIRSAIAVALLSFGLRGCLAPPPDLEGIGFRDARYREAQAMRDWRDCRDEGLALEREAGRAAAPARHLAAARVLEGCESGLGPEASALAAEERMQAYAVAIQGRLKGGDPAGARAGLQRFRTAFPNRDLYFDDGTSFLDTLESVLDAGAGARGPDGGANAGGANVGGGLAGELRRLVRWRRG